MPSLTGAMLWVGLHVVTAMYSYALSDWASLPFAMATGNRHADHQILVNIATGSPSDTCVVMKQVATAASLLVCTFSRHDMTGQRFSQAAEAQLPDA